MVLTNSIFLINSSGCNDVKIVLVKPQHLRLTGMLIILQPFAHFHILTDKRLQMGVVITKAPSLIHNDCYQN